MAKRPEKKRPDKNQITAEALKEISGQITEMLPALVLARIELESKLGRDHETVQEFNDFAVEMASINADLKAGHAYLTVKKQRKDYDGTLQRIDDAMQKWERAGDMFDHLQAVEPVGQIMDKRRQAQRANQPFADQDERETRFYELIRQLAGSTDEQWAEAQRKSGEQRDRDTAMFTNYESRLDDMSAAFMRFNDRMPVVLEALRDITEYDKDFRKR